MLNHIVLSTLFLFTSFATFSSITLWPIESIAVSQIPSSQSSPQSIFNSSNESTLTDSPHLSIKGCSQLIDDESLLCVEWLGDALSTCMEWGEETILHTCVLRQFGSPDTEELEHSINSSIVQDTWSFSVELTLE